MTSQFIPQKYQPSKDVQRQQIERAREEFRQQGFAAELNIEALLVQSAGDDESVEAQIKQFEHSRDNAYASARRMDEMLKKLPAPKGDKKGKQ